MKHLTRRFALPAIIVGLLTVCLNTAFRDVLQPSDDQSIEYSQRLAKSALYGDTETAQTRQIERNIELYLQTGTVVFNAQNGKYGLIKSGDLNISVHFEHSYVDRRNLPVEGSQVYFFAVPLEYVVVQDEVRTIAPGDMLAVNISTNRKMLLSKPAAQRRTPCGTGLTILPDSLLLSPDAQVISKEGKNLSSGKEYLNYVINDYGHLMIMRHSQKIQPWQKVVAYDSPMSRSNSPKCSPGIEREILDVFYKQDDPDWEWQ